MTDEDAPENTPGDADGADDQPGRIARWKATGTAKIDAVRERSMIVDLGFGYVDRWNEVNASVVAGHIAFRAFLWLVPMVLMVSAILSFATAADVDLGSPGSVFDVSGGTVDTIEKSAKEGEGIRFQAAVVAILGVTLGARALVKAANLAFAQVWQIPDRKPEGLVAAAMRFLGGVVLVAMAIGFVISLRRQGAVGFTLGIGTTLTLFFFLVLGMSLGLPRRGTDWRDLVPGSVLGMALLILLEWFSIFYLPIRMEKYQAIYGPIGLSLVFLTYLFLLSTILVATAVTNAMWLDERSRFPHIDELLQRVPGPRPSAEDSTASDSDSDAVDRDDGGQR